MHGIFFSLLAGLLALEAFAFPFVIILLSEDSPRIQPLYANHFYWKILVKYADLNILIWGICLFLVPFINDFLSQKAKRPFVWLLGFMIVPFWESVIHIMMVGWTSTYAFFGRSAVTWYVANSIAFILGLVIALLFDKLPVNKMTIRSKREKFFIYSFAGFLFSSIVFSALYAYQNLFAYGWLKDNMEIAIWHLAFLVNLVFNTAFYYNALIEGKI